MPHRITIEPEYRGPHWYVYNFRCSCGARGNGHKSKGAAEAAGRKHQEKAGAR